MTSRELVKAAIKHCETEYIPYSIDFTEEAKENLKQIVGDQDIDRFVDNDVINVGPPWWGWHELMESDWKSPAVPVSKAIVVGGGSYSEFFDSLKKLRDETDKYILVVIYGSHFEKAYFARGIENLLADLAGEPAFARELLNAIIEKNLVMLDNFIAAPEIDGVLLGSDWGTQQDLIMSPATWENMIRPGEQKEYDLIHSYGKDVWIHSCGKIEKIIPSLIEMGVDVLNPVQSECMDLQNLKDSFGQKLTFWGGLSTQRTLPFGTPENVKKEARQVKDLMAKGGGYIFSPSQTVQGDVPLENITALIEAAKEPYKK